MKLNWQFNQEPAVWVEFLKQALLAAAVLGLPLGKDQIVVCSALIGFAGALVVRQSVTANPNVASVIAKP